MNRSFRVLYVVNKKLPTSDYRICYGEISRVCEVLYGMPGKTDSLTDFSYVYMGFEEGWRFSYLLEFFRLYFYLRTQRRELDFVHFYSTNLILFGPIIAYFAGIQSIVTLTGFGRVFTSNKFNDKLLRPVYKFFLGISIRLSQQYLFQNHADLKLLSLEYPKQARKFSFIGSAVDFPQILKKDFSAQNLRIVLVARIMPDKGIDDFIRVAEELSGDCLEFTLIGPSSKGYEDLWERVVVSSTRKIVHYKGECSSEEVSNELAQSHIFYFPSSGEGMSRTMLEAGFSLLCPIAYNIPANRDLIADGRGVLLPIGDIKNVKSTLKELASDRMILAKNAHSYQNYIVNNYDMKTYSERMDNLLLELLPQRK